MESRRAPWLENTPEKPAASGRKPRKADPVSEETRDIVRKRAGGLCECCGEEPLEHFHHRQLRRGNAHGPSNIIGLSNKHHTRVHGHVRYSLDTGLIVSQYDDPAMREMLWRGRDWVYLGAGGELLHLPPPSESCS